MFAICRIVFRSHHNRSFKQTFVTEKWCGCGISVTEDDTGNFTRGTFYIDHFSSCVSYFWVGLLRLVSALNEIYTAFRYDALSEVRRLPLKSVLGSFL